jgi:hypothetical protein
MSASVPSSNAVRASPFPAAPKARYLEFGRLADSRSPHPRVLPAFGPSAELVSPTMPSADFCTAVRSPYGDLSLVAETQRRSPEVRPTAFAARPPDLPPRSLMTVDFAITCLLVRPGRPRYPVLVHRAAALLHASFRPHLAMTPLRFANPSPPSGWIEDLHLQAVDHARHTRKAPQPRLRGNQSAIQLSPLIVSARAFAPRCRRVDAGSCRSGFPAWQTHHVSHLDICACRTPRACRSAGGRA